MKIESIFHVLVFWTAVLIFSTSFAAIAQQTSVQAEAVAAAEQDAQTDVNGTLWFLGGCLGGCLGWSIVVGGLAVPILAYVYEPTPLASRLMGKSPEYVAFYTDTYKVKSKKIQVNRAWAGCITGGVLTGVGYVALIVAVAAIEEEE